METEKQRKIRPTVQHDNWRELLEALESTYTISFKEVCRILRASRPWTNQYVKPFVPYIFINSGQRGDTSSGKINWVRMAAMQLNRPEMTESVWFHKEDFKTFITECVYSCTKQTKPVPFTYLIPEDHIEGFVKEREELREEMKEITAPMLLAKKIEAYNALPFAYFRNDPATKKLLQNTARITDRTKAPAVKVPLPPNFIEKWAAPHDLKDYGDADETIYRRLFQQGCIRIELRLKDEAEKCGTKIFYVADPEPIYAPNADEGFILVTEQAWQEYKKQGK